MSSTTLHHLARDGDVKMVQQALKAASPEYVGGGAVRFGGALRYPPFGCGDRLGEWCGVRETFAVPLVLLRVFLGYKGSRVRCH